VTLNSIGFDPSLFHDDNGRKWLVNMMWDFRPNRNRFAGIVVQEYDHLTRRLTGSMTRILAKDVLTEGPNLYKRAGWYYLLLAEGGTGWNHGISMARARSITGPYELDPQPSVLTTRDAPDCPLQKAGHGELVQTSAGEWYLVHLASRPLQVGDQRRCLLGRETCLQKVIWSDDGWLRLAEREAIAPEGTPPTGEDVAAAVTPPSRGRTAAPGTKPSLVVPAPRGIAPHAWPMKPTYDDFDEPQLDPSWSSLRGPVEESWLSLTARPGWLRLRGRESLHSLFHQSLVAQRLTEHRCTVRTCLEFRPEHFTQSAGLICYYDTRTHFYLRVTHDEARGRILGVVLTDDGAYSELADSPAGGDRRRAPAICRVGRRVQMAIHRSGARRLQTFRRLRCRTAFHRRVCRSVCTRPWRQPSHRRLRLIHARRRAGRSC
jgi:xylan 1,4-beta-xylosidase